LLGEFFSVFNLYAPLQLPRIDQRRVQRSNSVYFRSILALPQSVNGSQAFPQSMEANEESLNLKFRFKDGVAKNAARVPKAKWDEHKKLLCSLYQEMTISDIRAFMRTEHSFVAR